MSKAVVRTQSEGKNQVITVSCEYSKKFTVYLQKNIHKNIKSYDGNGTWTFTGGSQINAMILEKVTSIFGIEEEVKIVEVAKEEIIEIVKEEIKEEIKEEVVETISCDLSFTETIQDVVDCCEKAFNLDFSFLKYENIECVESLQTAYLQGDEFSIDGAYGYEIFRTKIDLNEKSKEIAYYNENSWYLINGNYKDIETIEEEEIDLKQYKIIIIESSECDIDYGFDERNGVAKLYTWKGRNDVWLLEEDGCFTRFNSCEELENFVNNEERFEY